MTDENTRDAMSRIGQHSRSPIYTSLLPRVRDAMSAAFCARRTAIALSEQAKTLVAQARGHVFTEVQWRCDRCGALTSGDRLARGAEHFDCPGSR